MRFLHPAPLALVLAAFALFAGGCATPNATRTRDPRAPAFISLERTASAPGTPAGPVYVVTLFADGRVLFEGYSGVKQKGTFTRTVPPAEADAIFAMMDTIDLWNRDRRYDVERANQGGDSVIVNAASTEIAWDILRARDRGRSIRIDGLFFAPHELLALKALVEKTTRLADWVAPVQDPQQ